MISARLLVTLVPLSLLVACGGESFREVEDETGGEGGSSAGRGGGSQGGSGNRGGSANAGTSGDGSGGTGTAGTGSAGTGSAGTGGYAGTENCLAYPTCGPGEVEVPGPGNCAPGGVCYAVSICGSEIWCTSGMVQCTAVPTCDPGDAMLMGACPPEYSCYERTTCGSTITCLDQTCNPDTEYNRQYLFDSCGTTGDWAGCTLPNTKMFENECGCGCEQDPLCPAHLNCRATPVPLPAEQEAPADPPQGMAGTGTGSGAAAPPMYRQCEPAELEHCPFSQFYAF